MAYSKLTIFLLNLIAFAILFLCNNTNSCSASRRLLLDFKKLSTSQFGVEQGPPSLLNPSFPAPEIAQTPPMLPTFPSLQLPFAPPPSPPSPLPSSTPLSTDPSPPASPVLANFTPVTFPFPHLLPLPKFPPFPFIPTTPLVPSLPTVPSGFISSPSGGEEEPSGGEEEGGP